MDSACVPGTWRGLWAETEAKVWFTWNRFDRATSEETSQDVPARPVKRSTRRIKKNARQTNNIF
jgi:hypothetical protein